jgi:hypothetical protein
MQASGFRGWELCGDRRDYERSRAYETPGDAILLAETMVPGGRTLRRVGCRSAYHQLLSCEKRNKHSKDIIALYVDQFLLFIYPGSNSRPAWECHGQELPPCAAAILQYSGQCPIKNFDEVKYEIG